MATTAVTASASYSASTIYGTTTCGEYFSQGGFCPVNIAVKKSESTSCPSAGRDPIGCRRTDCCTNGADPWGATPSLQETNQGVQAAVAPTPGPPAAAKRLSTCGDLKGENLATKVTFWSKASCIAMEQTQRADDTPCGSYSNDVTAAPLTETKILAGSYGAMVCTNYDCCQFDPSIRNCAHWFKSNMCAGESPEGDLKSCRATTCTKDKCCYKAARTCNVGFFPTQKCDLTYYYDRPSSQTCSSYDCTVADCCKIKPNIGKCTTWWDANNDCGDNDAKLKYRKKASTRCPTYQCKETDCCDAGKTCAGYTGCELPKVLTHLTSTPCKNGVCDTATCCVTRAQCGATDCISPAVVKDDAKSSAFRCAATPCTTEECCHTPPGATPAPPATPSPTTVGPKSKGVTCDTFKDCTGKDTKGRKYTTSVGKAVKCLGSCDKETCCSKEAEATCFPGEAGVIVEDGSLVALAGLELNTALLGEDHVEPVIGVLHSHSDTSATALHSTPVSS